MEKKIITDSIVVVGGGIGLIAMGMFTDYTLSIARVLIPSWMTIVIGAALIIGWFILCMTPAKYDAEGNPLVKPDATGTPIEKQ